MHLIQKYYRNALFACLLLSPSMAQANPVACFNTNMGNFCIELFETQTPITTANFLNYINSGAYTNGIFHRSVPGFVIQGGGFKIVDGTDGKSLAAVNTFAPIANEFKLSNKRGAVAMAKVPDDPNSATSQWFVNLADNSLNLDSQNGGFTVFGRVIFDGMTVIDAIENLPVTNLGGNLAATPTIDFDGSQTLVSNFVQIGAVAVTETTGIFSEGILSFPVITETGDLFEANLRLIEDNPEFVFELDLSSITPLHTGIPAVATFSSLTGLLKIPSVMISASTSVKNVSMKLTHAESYQFTLQSYE